MRWLVATVLSLVIIGGAGAQDAPELLFTLGRGDIVSTAWSPDGESVWIGTTAGMWQLDANLQDIAAYPHITYGALSPDGRHIAGTSRDGYVAVWDAATGEETDRWETGEGSPEIPGVPVWSPESDRFIFNRFSNQHTSASLFTLNWRGGPNQLSYGPAKYAAWSETGAYGAIYDPELQKILVFTSTGESVLSSDGIGDLSLSGETTYLRWRGNEELTYSSYGDGGNQYRWSIPDGRSLEVTPYSVCAGYGGCTYNRDGNYGARGANAPGHHTMTVFDLATQTVLFEYEADKGYPVYPAWGPDSRRVAARLYMWPQHESEGIVVLDRGTSEVVWERNDTDISPEQLLWSPDGTRIFISDSGGRMAILDGDTGDVVAEVDMLFSATLALFNPDDTLVAVASTGGSLRIIDTATGETTHIWPRSGPMVAEMRWQPGRTTLAVRDRQRYMDVGPVTIWTADAQDEPTTIAETIYTGGSTSGARSFAWKPDGTALGIGGYDRIWIHEDGETIELPFPEPLSQAMFEQPVIEMTWHVGQDLPIAAYLQPCSHCHGYSQYPEAIYDYSSNASYTSVAGGWRMMEDGQIVTLHYQKSGLPRTLTLTTTGERESVLEGSSMLDTERAWVSPRAGFVTAIDTNGDGIMWDDSGAAISFLSNVENLIWSPDDATLAILQRDGSVWLQNADGLRLLWLPTLPVQSPGAITWSNDSRTLALVQDGMLRVWRL